MYSVSDMISTDGFQTLESPQQPHHSFFKSSYITKIDYDAQLNDTVAKRLHRITPIMFARPRTISDENETEEVCTDSLDEFPDIFTEEQLRSGYFVLAFPVGIYCFTLLAVICDSYFLPCVERICEALNLSQVSK